MLWGMKKQNPIPTARKAHIFLDAGQWYRLKEAYQAGHSVAHLAKVFGVARGTIDTRRKREHWLRGLPDGLVLLGTQSEPPPPVSDLEAAGRHAADRAVLAFNAGDVDAARELASLCALLIRVGQQTHNLDKAHRPGALAEPARPHRDMLKLFAERLSLPAAGGEEAPQ